MKTAPGFLSRSRAWRGYSSWRLVMSMPIVSHGMRLRSSTVFLYDAALSHWRMSAKYWSWRAVCRTLLGPLRGRTQLSSKGCLALSSRKKQKAIGIIKRTMRNETALLKLPMSLVSGAPSTNKGSHRRAKNGCHFRYAQNAIRPQTSESAYQARSRSRPSPASPGGADRGTRVPSGCPEP